MTIRAAALATIAVLLSAAPGAQTPSGTAFRFERPIVVAGDGPQRLPIDVALLTGGSPFTVVRKPAPDGEIAGSAIGGLADLRLIDAAGNEVPYLLVPNPDAEPAWRAATALLPVAPVETETVRTSGFEADLGEAVLVDRFRIDRLPPPYLKRLRLEGSGDRSRWTLLVDEGTVFDLPASRLRQTELAFAAGSYRYLRVTWDDTRSGRVGPPAGVSAREVATPAAAPVLTAPLVFERRPSEPGRSRFHVRLPAARLPIIAIELDVASGHVMRDIEVYEARLTGSEAVPALIGRGTLRRVEQNSLAASALRVTIQPPVEPEIDVLVDDGDNPPLELRGITARFAELPWIYFESRGAAVARYGSPVLAAPRYDLEAVRQTLRIEQVADASWGEPRQRSDAENITAPAPALPTVGAPIDASMFQYVRDLPPGDAGLMAVRLDEAALAHSRGAAERFGDVRIIDDDGRQVPYLVERSAEPLSMDVTIERLETPPPVLGVDQWHTVYRVTWPHGRLPAARLVLTTSARIFQRRVTVATERAPDRRRRDPWAEILASTTWAHAVQETPAASATIPLPATELKELFVMVAEGDNSVLPIAGARLLFPQYRLRLFREADAVLRLAYGRADLSAPSYDLALLAPRLLGVTAVDVAPEAERSGPAQAPVSIISPRLFWAVLAAAVIVLLALIVRLIRQPLSSE